jgi:hypothetical protein
MAGESTSTTLTGWYTTELSKRVEMYPIDPNCAQKFVYIEGLDGQGKIKAFSRITKDTALSGNITEGTGLSNTALDTDQVTATVAEFGIMRQFTKLGERTNMLGTDGLIAVAYQDGVAMCLERFESLVWAQFANASTSVGTTGAAFTVANVVQAQSQHVVNKSRGEVVGFLPATAGKNLRQDVVATGAAVFANGAAGGLLERPDPQGFMGSFLGTAHYTNNLGTASGADTIGAYMVNGSQAGSTYSTGVALGWMPEAALLQQPTFSGGTQIAVTMALGMVEVHDAGYVKTTTIT